MARTNETGSRFGWKTLLARIALAAAALSPAVAAAQLNEHCVVSVLNRTVQVKPDGTWVLPNIPANFGSVKARATCVENGITRSGESAPFTIPTNGSVNVPRIVLGATTPIPARVVLTAPTVRLTAPSQSVQIAVAATYPDGREANITGAAQGTQYLISNPALASISADGIVTARQSGTVVVQAVNEGTQGLLQLTIALSGDTDGDGIPDDIEIREGLNPANPVDALEDPDHDGLSNRDEIARGTAIRIADTDGDGILDGEEVVPGADGYITNPLLADTDGDGIRDLTEIQTGSDPTNANSTNLPAAVTALEVSPPAFTLVVNSISGVASVQLTVLGRLRDGTTIDLTDTRRGTNYSSSDITVCNFGSPDGRVFAGNRGTCTITVTNGAFTARIGGEVQDFSPQALSFVSIPGYANDVAVTADHAWVAAGSRGLQVVSLSADRRTPSVLASLALPGNANAITLVGNRAYIAAGTTGLHVVDISAPATPRLLGSFNTGGNALGVKIVGGTAFIANGSNLRVLNVANPAAIISVSTLPLSGTIWNLDIDPARNLAAVAGGSGGLHLVDISNPTTPVVRGRLASSDARGVVLRGNYAFIADYAQSIRSADITDLANPRALSGTTLDLGGRLQNLVLSGSFALGADVYFVNGVPIVDVTDPATVRPRAILNFPARDDNGMGIAADSGYVYLAADRSGLNRGGTTGDSRLYIGQFQPLVDLGGVPPSVAITRPLRDTQLYEGESVTLAVNAVDDVAVASVQFLVDGQVVFTSTSAPYEYALTVPTGVGALTLGARAIDLGGNVGSAPDVPVLVAPDPLTTVTGRVTNIEGVALAGAVVTAPGGRTATTDADGRFTITGVPSVLGNIFASFVWIDATNVALTGTSTAFPPVRGGTTDLGTTTLVGARFERNYGTFVSSCDDCSFTRTLPFTFPFYGTNRTTAYVGTNGYITFNSGDSTYTETVPGFSSQPRISAFFDDLYGRSQGGMYINDTIPGQFVVTHDRVQHFSAGGSNTLQIQLFRDGRIILAYSGISALATGSIAGITPGAGSLFQQVDFSAQRNFDAPDATAVFEYFTNTNPFDLDGGFVVFTPLANGGYNVRTIPAPPAAPSAALAGGPAAVLPAAPVARTARTTAQTTTTQQPVVNLANAEILVRSSADPTYRGMTNTDARGRFTLRGVPPGGVNIDVRRNGRVIAQGAGVFPGGTLTPNQLLGIVLKPVPTTVKAGPNK